MLTLWSAARRCYNTGMEILSTYQRSKRAIVAVGMVAALMSGCTSAEDTTHPPVAETTADSAERYASHDNITATVFWIGEPADESNDFITNVPTAWDDDASVRLGGYDGPITPNGSILDVPRDANGVVTEFTPLHNPYYFALPAAEFNNLGLISGAREASPWADEIVAEGESLFKGRPAAITAGNTTIYAQWLDVGPNATDDYDYVFGDGSQPPKNDFGLRAGIDLSPAAAVALGFTDGSQPVSWRFVDEMPDGPWNQYPPIDNKTYWG